MIFSRRASITNLMALKTIRVEFNKGRQFGIDAFAYSFTALDNVRMFSHSFVHLQRWTAQ